MSKKRRTKNKRARLENVSGEADILYTTRKQSERRRDKKMAMEGVAYATLGATKKRKEMDIGGGMIPNGREEVSVGRTQ